tara:strand:- start:126 stop:311 length:186 start_codon:yes stop_codon:yes gene_type:complete
MVALASAAALASFSKCRREYFPEAQNYFGSVDFNQGGGPFEVAEHLLCGFRLKTAAINSSR